jgi:heme-degrading monooxygenase HmoA
VFARSTTIHGQPAMTEAGIRHVRDVVMPQVRGLSGCVGISLLADRSNGRCIVTTAWESQEALRGSADTVAPIRARAAKEFGGEVTLDEWEVAYVHRSHHAGEGACARVTWAEADPEAIDRVVEAFRTSIMPRVEQLDGFCSASLMIDRARGRSCVTASYDSTEAMAHAADAAMGLRADLVQETGMRVMEVAEFELALAHLDVPELV